MHQRRPSNKHNEAGFTLIELLVAAVLLVIGVMAMSGLVALTVANNGHSRLDSTATMINQAVVEQVVSGIDFQSHGSGTGTAYLYDCGDHTVAASNPWPVYSNIGGAPIANGKIDFTQAAVTGYQMDYVVCTGNSQATYDVRWNISALVSTGSTSFTHILTVGSRLHGGPSIINFPINMRVMVGPDPPKGT
jgi:prepilin-type N-terminal cleavage/methylation domain-containing protein